MTKEEFLKGEKFIYKNRYFRFVPREGKFHGGYITSSGGYECSIDKIGTKIFHCFNILMGKLVNIKVRFEDCEIVVEENSRNAAKNLDTPKIVRNFTA
tara:strand:+ start:264 stop:557 length:294 start_codon:yes stop_codon:yes gene_type:complete